LFGWAKPVPYNPNNFYNKKWGTIFVAAAGIVANFSIAIIFGVIIRIGSNFNMPDGFYFITSIIVVINLALGIFNLVPIPPLDGSKILFSFLPYSLASITVFFEQYAFVLLFIFIIYFSKYLYPLLSFLFTITTGLAL
jgi:Zn-dependent protease